MISYSTGPQLKTGKQENHTMAIYNHTMAIKSKQSNILRLKNKNSDIILSQNEVDYEH